MSALSFFVRQPIHCVRCGYACESVSDPNHHAKRTVRCLNAQCSQYNKPATVLDPVIVLLTEMHEGYFANVQPVPDEPS